MISIETLLLSIIITLFIFIKFEYKSTFLELYSKLFHTNPKQQRKVLERLIDYLTYSNAELATFNAGKYKFIPYQLLYHIFRFVFIFLTLLLIYFLAIEFNITVFLLILLILLLPTFIISIPIIILLNSRDFKPAFESKKALIKAIFRNCRTYLWTISLMLIIYLFINNLNKIDLLDIFAFPDSTKPFNSINGNILSLASIYFTFAIGGTVVFSVLKPHYKQLGKLKATIDKLKIVYIEWIEEKSLDDKIFNFKKAKTFNIIVNVLRDKVEPGKIDIIKGPVIAFYLFVFFVLSYYLMGIILIFGKGFWIEGIFIIGNSFLIPYLCTLLLIFKYYGVAHQDNYQHELKRLF